MRKGYWFVLAFSLFIAVAQVIKNEVFVLKKGNFEITKLVVLKFSILFLVFFIPGLLLVKWYYKMKNNQP